MSLKLINKLLSVIIDKKNNQFYCLVVKITIFSRIKKSQRNSNIANKKHNSKNKTKKPERQNISVEISQNIFQSVECYVSNP